MAGTMMKTSSRVKRTVREMPRRLTIKLSKGSNRNMVEDAGQAGFHTQTRLQMIPSDSTSLGKEASPLQVTNSISKFISSHCLNTDRAVAPNSSTEGPQEHLRIPGLSGADRAVVNEAGHGFRNSIQVWTVSGQVSGKGELSVRLCGLLPRFYFFSCSKAFSR